MTADFANIDTAQGAMYPTPTRHTYGMGQRYSPKKAVPITADMMIAARRENGLPLHHVLKRTTISGTAYPTSGGAHGKHDRHTFPR